MAFDFLVGAMAVGFFGFSRVEVLRSSGWWKEIATVPFVDCCE